MSRILVIDNFDSFTHNLVDEFAKRRCKVEVYRNNVGLDTLAGVFHRFVPKLLVVSPGPSSPAEAGNSIQIVQEYYPRVPIFGVCLGHQVIVEAFGGKVGRAPEPVHGKSGLVRHDGKTIYQDVENPFRAGRYHSLCAFEIPECLEQTATTGEINMGVRHKEYLVEGVQFHPESILTPVGGKIVENWLEMIKQRRY